MRIRTKLILLSAVCLTGALAALTTFTSQAVMSQASEGAEQQLSSSVHSEGNSLAAQFGKAIALPTNLALVLSSVKDPALNLDMPRESVAAILEKVVRETPGVRAVFTCWAPEAYDELDEVYAGIDGFGELGRFRLTCSLADDRSAKFSYLEDCEDESRIGESARAGDYYLIPREKGVPAITHPAQEGGHSPDLSVVRITVPIDTDSGFVGIAGIDLDLSFLQEQVDQYKLYDGAGSLNIYDSNGLLIARSGGVRGDEPPIVSVANLQVSRQLGRVVATSPVALLEGCAPWTIQVEVPEQVIYANAETLQTDQTQLGFLTGVLGLIALSIAAYRITRPLGNAVEMIETIARGDLSSTWEHESSDELGEMSRALSKMSATIRALHDDMGTAMSEAQSGSLNVRVNPEPFEGAYGKLCSDINILLDAIVSPIRRLSDTVDTQSETMSDVSKELERGAEAVFDQINQLVEVSEGIRRGLGEVSLSVVEMDAGSLQVANSTASMGEVAREAVLLAELTTEKIERLEAGSREIEGVLQLITDIAEQTNLLALNATIEAARAGEAGQGFAVVANEVKELAKQTARATEEVSQKVNGIKERTEDTGASILHIMETISRIGGIESEVTLALKNHTQLGCAVTRTLRSAEESSNDVSGQLSMVVQQVGQSREQATRTHTASGNLASAAKELSDLVGE